MLTYYIANLPFNLNFSKWHYRGCTGENNYNIMTQGIIVSAIVSAIFSILIDLSLTSKLQW